MGATLWSTGTQPLCIFFFCLDFHTQSEPSLCLTFPFLFAAFLSSSISSKPSTKMSTPPIQPYTSRGRAISRQSTRGPRGIDRENLRTPQRISSAPPRLRPIREAENEPPARHLPSSSTMPFIEAPPPPPPPPPPELDIPHESLMLLELRTNVKVGFHYLFPSSLRITANPSDQRRRHLQLQSAEGPSHRVRYPATFHLDGAPRWCIRFCGRSSRSVLRCHHHHAASLLRLRSRGQQGKDEQRSQDHRFCSRSLSRPWYSAVAYCAAPPSR